MTLNETLPTATAAEIDRVLELSSAPIAVVAECMGSEANNADAAALIAIARHLDIDVETQAGRDAIEEAEWLGLVDAAATAAAAGASEYVLTVWGYDEHGYEVTVGDHGLQLDEGGRISCYPAEVADNSDWLDEHLEGEVEVTVDYGTGRRTVTHDDGSSVEWEYLPA